MVPRTASPRRALATLAATALIPMAAVVALTPTPAHAASLDFCTSGGPRPCVESIDVNSTGGPGAYGFIGSADVVDGSKNVSFTLTKNDNSDLGAASLSDIVEVTFDMGSWVPRVVSGKGQDGTVVREKYTEGDGGYRVTVTLTPVSVSGQCDGNGYCPEHWVATSPEFNNVEWAGTLSIDITDYGSWEDPDTRVAYYGMNYFTNIASTYLPPQIAFEDAGPYLSIQMENRRFRDDNTVVQGQAELRIPNAFLAEGYGVDKPGAMTSSGLIVNGVGSSATYDISQEPGGDAMLVDLSNITFPNVSGPAPRAGTRAARAQSSTRDVSIKLGDLTPGLVTNLRGSRTSSTSGLLTWSKAPSRGAYLRGYAVRCTAPGVAAKSVTTSRPKATVTGLKSGKAYSCTVRAKSTRGTGKAAPAVTIPAH